MNALFVNGKKAGMSDAKYIALARALSALSRTTLFIYSEWFDGGFSVTFCITDLLDSQTFGTRYTLTNWKNKAGSIIASPQTITSPNTFTAYYQTQYCLTVNTNPSNLSPQPNVSPIGPWYNNGTLVACTAQAFNGYAFEYWILDVSNQQAGKTQVTVTMNAPHTATAHYRSTGANPPIEGLLQVLAFFAVITIFAFFERRKKS